MFICLAAFIILLIAMAFWPLVRLFSKSSAKKLDNSFRDSIICIGKRTSFQKCEVRFEDRIKNAILKKVIIKHPGATKPVAILIQAVSVLIILAAVFGISCLVALILN